MNEQSLTVPKNSLEKTEGFLSRMADVLSDDKVKAFFRDYFSTWTDAKTALMMMHTFVVIDEGYFQSSGKRLSSSELSEMVRQVVADRDCRPILVEAMKEFMHGGEEKFYSTFQRIAAPKKVLSLED